MNRRLCIPTIVCISFRLKGQVATSTGYKLTLTFVYCNCFYCIHRAPRSPVKPFASLSLPYKRKMRVYGVDHSTCYCLHHEASW
jgi:hypothetical protein